MKRAILTFSLLTAGLMATTDFSQKTTSELIKLWGKVAIEDREAFRAEMRSRVATMSTEERNAFIASRRANCCCRGRNRRVQDVNAPTFASIDTNGDGAIDANEFQAHQTAQMAQRQGMRRGRQVKTQRVGGGHSRP